ncbi:MAG: hypothetical protein GXO64_04210 [Candidatus Micrarchaeota archaeon]|nr:hypothetical protein [Candidatus Micrarchaeota archaeon]
MKLLYISVFVLISISFAGCTGINNSQSFGNGLNIETFEPVINEKPSGQPVAFRVKLRNTGTETAYNVEATLANVEEFDLYDNQEKFFDEIASGALGTEQPVVSWSWDLDAPSVPSGTRVLYKPTLKVKYVYKSETVKSITLVPVTELREIENGGGSLPSETVSRSGAPISLDIEIKGPISFFKRKIKFPISIVLRNAGGGSVCRNNCEDEEKDYNVLDLYMHTGDIELSDCNIEGIRLTGGSATVVCNAQIDLNKWHGKNENDLTVKKNIRFDTVYTYTITKTTELTVYGR